MSQPPSSPDYDYSSDAADALPGQFSLNYKLMVAAIIVLFFVVFFILSLHLHRKWLWTYSSSFMISNGSSQRLHFTGQEVNSAEAARNIGLGKAAIDQLPTFIYKVPKGAAPGGGESALIECAVCLTEFQENDKGRLLPTCKHSFHTDCIGMWFHSHSTCPLCRTVVMMPTPLSSSTSEQQQQQAEEDVQQQVEIAMEAHLLTHNDPVLTRAREGTSVPSTINYGNATMQCPSNALFWSTQTQIISQLSSSQGLEKPPPPPPPPPSSTRRSIPQITIEIPTRQDNLTSPGCLSLSSLSRSCPSPCCDQACSSEPIKSPGLRMSIKRKLSRQSSKGKRIFGSYLQEGGQSPKDITTLPV